MCEQENYFSKLNAVNVKDKIEKKNGLSYLSWAWAWGEVKKRHPDANYKVYENADGWNYFTDGKTAWVKTSVTINGIEHVDYLPIMNNRNASIPVKDITSFDVNKTIQRSITKACARHGLGLYIYAGEDLPEDESGKEETQPAGEDSGSSDKEIDESDRPTPEDIAELEKYGGTIEGVATFYNIPQFAVTHEMVQKLIAKKKRILAKEAAAKGEANA